MLSHSYLKAIDNYINDHLINPIRPGGLGGGGGSEAQMTKFRAAIQKLLCYDAQT